MLSMRQFLVGVFLVLLPWLGAGCSQPVQTVSPDNLPTALASQANTETIPLYSPQPGADDKPAGIDPAASPSPARVTSTPLPTSTAENLTPSATPTLAHRAWRMAPVIPTTVSRSMINIYQLGQQMGNNPHAFSKVGDCQTMLPDFLGDFDSGKYNLGEYTYLQPVVDYFSDSFGRYSRSVKDGLTASGAVTTLWNTWKDCEVEETPLACEYRINQPSFAFISLGTNDANGLVPFEDTLRRVIEVTLERGIVPILVTKADNAEGDWSINETIFQLAYEYEIPVWNFWLAVQPLPLHGLRSPEHLTYGEYVIPGDFSIAENMQYAYNVRNLTALQVLDTVWRAVTNQPASDFIPTPVFFLP